MKSITKKNSTLGNTTYERRASGSVSIVFGADRSQIDQYLAELRAGIKIPVSFVPQTGAGPGPASAGFSVGTSGSTPYRFVSAPVAPPSPSSSTINGSLLPSSAPGLGGAGGGTQTSPGIAALSQAAAALNAAAAALTQSAGAMAAAAGNVGGGGGPAPAPNPAPGGAPPGGGGGGGGGGRPTLFGMNLGRLARVGTVAYLPYQVLETVAKFEEAGTRSAIANKYGSALDRAIAGGYAQNAHDALAATPGINLLNSVINEAYSPFGPSNRETALAIRGAQEGQKDVLAQQERYAATLASGDRVRQTQREATTGTISGSGARQLSTLSDNFIRAKEARRQHYLWIQSSVGRLLI